jgi:hypothetical protein
MGIVAMRVFIYSLLPVIIAAVHVGLDKSIRSRERILETFLLYLFAVGVAGSGIGGFFGHFFLSDSVAESTGWPVGNPFQLEVGLPIWHSVFLELSPWAGAMASVRPPFLPLLSWA